MSTEQNLYNIITQLKELIEKNFVLTSTIDKDKNFLFLELDRLSKKAFEQKVTLYCFECGTITAKLSNGSLSKKNSKGVCADCLSKIKYKKAADDLLNIGGGKSDYMDLFKDILGGK